MEPELVARQRKWLSFGRADVIFIGIILLMLPFAHTGMMDDPGLGWHLRVADQMWETGGFVREEPFCFTSEGQTCLAKSWLGDVLLRLAYAWGRSQRRRDPYDLGHCRGLEMLVPAHARRRRARSGGHRLDPVGLQSGRFPHG